MDDLPMAHILLGGVSVIILVAVNAFFVAAEFSLVAARQTRLASLAQQGDRKAILAYRAIQSLDRYISATQLGITLASLGLGWIGEQTVATTIEGIFAGLAPPFDAIARHGVASIAAFAFITILHIVFGELAPKAFALLHPETTSRWVAAPLMGFTWVANPFVWLLNGAANATLRMFGMRAPTEHERVHRPEEIVMLVRQSQRSGHLATQDVQLIEGVFEFTEKTARDVMTPRTEVEGLEADETVEEAAERVRAIGRSRYPVYRRSLDDIIGIVHAKDILASLTTRKQESVTSIMRRDPLFVPGSREVEDLLADMKRLKQHMAIVLDEYGGTAGIVTMEDLLEEIVGLIFDEYDDPGPDVGPGPDGTAVVGNMEIDEANKRYGLGLDTEQYQTVGGYVFGTLGRLPTVGDRVSVQGGLLEVAEMDGRRVAMLRLSRAPAGEEPATPDAPAE